MHNRILLLSLGAALLPLCIAQPSFAQTPLIDFTGGVGGVIGVASTRGFTFDVTTPTTIGGLGFFDTNNHVLGRTYDVGLWDSSGTLLASTTIGNASTSIASTSSLGQWLENSITPLVLNPGTYVLGAEYPDVDNTAVYVYEGIASSIGGVSYGTAAFANAPTLTLPTAQFGALDAAFFGPMAFTGQVAASTPEPGTYSLMGGLGLTGAAFLRRRRTR